MESATMTSGVTCPPIQGNFDLNIAVLESIPQGLKVIRADTYGTSAWSKTGKVVTEDAHGDEVLFFLKLVEKDVGKIQLEGEFVGMTELHKVMPTFVPKPIAWGELRGVPIPTSFFLIEFKQFTGGMPDPVKLGKRVAELHTKSNSPTGMFGFHLTTFDGARTQDVRWDPCWASFFTKLITRAYEHDISVNGRWDQLERVFDRAKTHLIPRLVGALESDGRSVKPCLIHGDMWEGNIGTDIETGDPWIFDAAVYYAHNEMELGIWQAERHRLRQKVYRKEYVRWMPPSEPVDEWHDRIRLYSVKTNLMFSACVPGQQCRLLAYNDLSYLIQKYVPWPEENMEKSTELKEPVESQHEIPNPKSDIFLPAPVPTVLLS